MRSGKDNSYPVIVGVGQVTLREKVDMDTFSAIDLARMAVESCVIDTGNTDIIHHIDRVSLVHSFSEPGGTPVDRLCKTIGIKPKIKEETTYGGNNPQWLVNRAADHISEGKIKTTLLVGSETFYRTHRPEMTVSVFTDTFDRFNEDPDVIGNPKIGYSPYEAKYHLDKPSIAYPLFENALCHHLGMTMQNYKQLLKSYFNALAGIAEVNPLAWFHGLTEKFPDDVTKVSEQNRMIGFPYTKFMNPIPFVNQAAAIIMTDSKTAGKLLVPEEKWIYIHGGAEAEEIWNISHRANFHSSPAIKTAMDDALQMAACRASDMDFFDLYSCYPCAVLIAASSLGLSLDDFSRMSITGGLPYFGGPGNNYTMHSIAHAVERLRKFPEQKGLVNGNGWYLTKHAVGIYSGLPPEFPWKRVSGGHGRSKNQAEMPLLLEKARGAATIETYTIDYSNGAGGRFPVIIARLDSGERCLATALDTTGTIDILEQVNCIGKRGMIETGGCGYNLFTLSGDGK